MSLRVFHPPGTWVAGQRIGLDPEESRYLLRVRRAQTGSEVELLDGQSAIWRARLVDSEGRVAVLELQRPRSVPEPMPVELLLVLPEPRATLDALTVASELGASAVHLIPGQHSPGGVPSTARIAKTLRAAQRQCGRPRVPTIVGPTSLDAALAATASRTGFVASPEPAHHGLLPPVDPARGARVLIGPEGGLSTIEEARARAAGLVALGLGPWVLRTPTAVSAALSRLWGPSS